MPLYIFHKYHENKKCFIAKKPQAFSKENNQTKSTAELSVGGSA